MIIYWGMLVLFSLFIGYHEGMINVKFRDTMHSGDFLDGVRGHKYHKSIYHKIRVLRDLSGMYFGYQLLSVQPNLMAIIASLFIVWEITEVFYAVARCGSVFMFDLGLPYENVAFLDIWDLRLRGGSVYIIHLLRIMFAFIFLLMSVL